MCEMILICAGGFLLLAAAMHRYRREAGLDGPLATLLLRATGVALILGALYRCAAPLTGERWVHLACGASLGAIVVVLGLSVAPDRMLLPIRLIARRRRR